MTELGEVYAWDVFNEAISNNNKIFYQDSMFAKIDDFVCTFFLTASQVKHKYNWDTLLFYNEYNAESMYGAFQNKSDKVTNLCRSSLKETAVLMA
jgi:GH35 family endo-1,4-beta-xylanase